MAMLPESHHLRGPNEYLSSWRGKIPSRLSTSRSLILSQPELYLYNCPVMDQRLTEPKLVIHNSDYAVILLQGLKQFRSPKCGLRANPMAPLFDMFWSSRTSLGKKSTPMTPSESKGWDRSRFPQTWPKFDPCLGRVDLD